MRALWTPQYAIFDCTHNFIFLLLDLQKKDCCVKMKNDQHQIGLRYEKPGIIFHLSCLQWNFEQQDDKNDKNDRATNRPKTENMENMGNQRSSIVKEKGAARVSETKMNTCVNLSRVWTCVRKNCYMIHL